MIQEAICNCLQKACKPLTYNQIVDHVKGVRPKTHPSTVYRNLEKMEQAGIVLRVGTLGRHTMYSLPEIHSHNLFCSACKKTINLPEEDLSDMELLLHKVQKRLGQKYNLNDISHILKFVGTCKACSIAHQYTH